MSHQVEPDTAVSTADGPGSGSADVAGHSADVAEHTVYVPQTPGTPVSYPPAFHGRPVSWVAVSIIMVGFLCGGLALIFGPTWWAFWLGLAVAVLGLLVSMAINIFDDWY
jgi:hypothetical protein